MRGNPQQKIGVIATEATINSGIYSSYITRQDPQIQVIGKGMSAVCTARRRRMAERLGDI